MYKYDEIDRAVLDARTAEFREQVHARLSGALSEDERTSITLKYGLAGHEKHSMSQRHEHSNCRAH